MVKELLVPDFRFILPGMARILREEGEDPVQYILKNENPFLHIFKAYGLNLKETQEENVSARDLALRVSNDLLMLDSFQGTLPDNHSEGLLLVALASLDTPKSMAQHEERYTKEDMIRVSSNICSAYMNLAEYLRNIK